MLRDEPEELRPIYILTAYIDGKWDDRFFGEHVEGENLFYSKREAERHARETVEAIKILDPGFDEDEFAWAVEEKEWGNHE